MLLKRKFYLIGASLILVVVILASATITIKSRLVQANRQEFSAIQVIEKLSGLEKTVASMRQLEVLIISYAAVANVDSVQSLSQRISKLNEIFLGRLSAIAIRQQEKRKLSELMKAYMTSIAVTTEYSNNYATDQAADNTTTVSAELYQKLSGNLDAIGDDLSKRSYSIKESAESIAAGATLVLFVILTGTLVTFVLAAVVIKKSVLTRIENAVFSAQKLANGNLHARIEVDAHDEIGKLGLAFNEMADKIAGSIDELEKEKAGIEHKVEAAVRESENEKKYLAQSTQQMLAAMRDFARGDLSVRVQKVKNDEIGQLFDGFNSTIENLNGMLLRVKSAVTSMLQFSTEIFSLVNDHAQRMQHQREQTVEVASAVQELSMTSNENTVSSDNAVQLATAAGEAARGGGSVINNSIKAMNDMAIVVDESSDNIRTLGTSSEQIVEIVKVIDEIADQTNLLALNAAIEAARAGEQGRGFAVVADEVRKLAERTTQATKEIESMIGKIQSDSVLAIDSMTDIKAKVKTGKDHVDAAGNALEEIIASAEKTINVINQVASSSREQASTSDHVSKNIDLISQSTQDSIDSNEAIKAATIKVAELNESIEQIIGQFKLVKNNVGAQTVETEQIGTPLESFIPVA